MSRAGAARPAAPRRAELAAISGLAIVGQGLASGLTVALSVVLAPETFATFAQCAALFLLAKTIAPFGMDRLALQVLPGLERDEGAPGVATSWQLALRRAAMGTGLGMAGMMAVGLAFGAAGPVALTSLGLPVAAAVQLLAVRAILRGQAVRAAATTRLVPALVVALPVAGFAWAGRPVTLVELLLMWGAGWAAATALLWGRGVASLRGRIDTPARPWSSHAGGFVGQSLMLATMRRAPVIVAGYLAPAPAVATLALSFALADLAGSLAPLLDGPFLRQAAQSKGAHLSEVFRRRGRVFAWLVAVPMALLVAAAPWLAGDVLPQAGWRDSMALAAVAVGTAALAYSGFPRKTLVRDCDQGWKLRLLAVCVGVELVLLVALAGTFGAAGAAAAFAVPALVAAALLTRRALRRLRAS